MAQIEFMDGLLKEYMIFRGFSSTLKTLEQEQKAEKEKTFRSEKIMEQFQCFVNSHDLTSLRELWSHLDNNLFNKLEHSYSVAVKKLENGLLKWYLVTAQSNNRPDKVSEFFAKLSSDLHAQSEWKDWFYFPFCKTPEESPIFQLYFSRQWQDTLQISLRNFLSVVYQCIPQPTFVRAEQEAILIKRLQEENANLKLQLQTLTYQQQQKSALGAGTSGSQSNLHSAASESAAYRRGRPSLKPNSSIQSLSDINPFDISPPGHVVDDFYIIASETANLVQYCDVQSRGLKMLIKNIGSSGSPVMGRKDPVEKTKRRSGSVGRNWI